jgi:hypothetical protein
MGLSSIQRSTLKRLPLQGKLPREAVEVPEPAVIEAVAEVAQPVKVEPPKRPEPAREEDKIYTKLVALNPFLRELVESLDLVSLHTREPLRELEIEEEVEVDPKLERLAKKLLKREKAYTREELLARVAEGTNTPPERAEKGVSLFIEGGVLRPTLRGDLYYLRGSTPF